VVAMQIRFIIWGCGFEITSHPYFDVWIWWRTSMDSFKGKSLRYG
jgi:hypothetical protein